MPYPKCKIYSDRSHYIAIPYIPKKPRYKKRKKIPPLQPKMKVVEDEGLTPFDKFEQMSLFDKSSAVDEPVSEQKEAIDDFFAKGEGNGVKAKQPPSRRDIFERLYSEYIYEPKGRRKKAIIEGMLPYSQDYEEAKLYVEANLRRKRNNLIARRVRMTRKANLQSVQADFNFFVTLTYSDELHTEDSFKKGLKICLNNLSKRESWKYMGVWERSPQKQRLHFHGIFYIPEGTTPGKMTDVNDYNFKSKRRRITHQNTYFNERFGRSDFEEIVDNGVLGEPMAYIMKYIEKSGERIVYSKNLPQFFLSDIMEEDIVCPYGEEEHKFILSDKFGCWDEGAYMGEVSSDTIAQMPKVN